MNNENIKDFFKNSVGYFAVAIVSIIYILTSFITIDKTGKTITEILADGALTFILGLMITRLFEYQGILNGERNDKVGNTYKLHSDIVTRLSPHLNLLDDWCEKMNMDALKNARVKILAKEGLKYDNCFDKDGVAILLNLDIPKSADKVVKRKIKAKLHAYHSAVKLKLTPLTANALISEGGREVDPYYMGRTKKEYAKTSNTYDVISRILIAIIFGYFGVSMISNFSWAYVIWTSLQVAVFITMGVIKMMQATMFITDEYRSRIVKKIDNLQKFENYINSLPKNDTNEQSLNEAKSDETKPITLTQTTVNLSGIETKGEENGNNKS